MKDIHATLTWQMGMLLIKSALLGAVLGLALFLGGSALLTDSFENAGWQEILNRRRIVSFQQYVTRNGLKATDSSAFTRWVTYYDVVFSDGTAEVVIFANDMAQANLYLATASALSGFLVFLGLFLWQCSKIVSYVCLLSRQIQDMEGGYLGVSITRRGNNELTRLADSLDSMRLAFAQQWEQETAEPLMSCKELFHDILLGQMECLSRKGFRFTLRLEWPEVRCRAGSGSIQRLMDNIFSNIGKYADKEQPVGIAIRRKGSGAELCFENRVLENPSPEESARIGLSVIQSVTEQMGGKLRITQDHGVFCLKLWLPDRS